MSQTSLMTAEPTTTFAVTLDTPSGDRVALVVTQGQYIWDAAQAAGITLPAICHQGRCLTCAGRLVGGGEFDQRDAASYFPQDREAGYILLCTAKPCSNLRIRTEVQEKMRDHRLRLNLPAPYA
jgi:ferredoxin